MFKQLEIVLFEYKNGRVIAVPGKYVTSIEMEIGNAYISKFNEKLVQRAFYVKSADYVLSDKLYCYPIKDVCGDEFDHNHIQDPIIDVTLVYADGEEELYIMTNDSAGFIVVTNGAVSMTEQEREVITKGEL